MKYRLGDAGKVLLGGAMPAPGTYSALVDAVGGASQSRRVRVAQTPAASGAPAAPAGGGYSGGRGDDPHTSLPW